MRSRLYSSAAIALVALAAFAGPRRAPAQAQSSGWHDIASLPVALSGAAAATGNDGDIYVFGGATQSGGLSNQTYVYDPSVGAWSTRAPMPLPVSRVGAALGSDGRIYVVGGYAGGPVNFVQVYDPDTNTWSCSQAASGCASSSLPPLPTARFDLAVVAGPNGTIWAIGGTTRDPLATVEVYSIAGNNWTTGPQFPYAADGVTAVSSPDGTIYAFGGKDLDGLTHLELYKLVSGASARRPTTQTGSSWYDAELKQFVQRRERLDLTESLIFMQWQFDVAFGRGSSPRHFRDRQAPAADVQIAFGGVPPNVGGPPSNAVSIWDSATNTVSAGPSLQQGRFDAAYATGHDGTLYAIGGDDGNPMNTTFFSSVEAYTPPPPPPPPTAAASPTSTLSTTVTLTGTPTLAPVPPSPTPTPTSTAIPLFVHISLAHKSIRAGQKQKISVRTLPDASVSIMVKYPDGKKSHHSATADGRGHVSWSYKQAAGRTRGANHTAIVTVSASIGTGAGVKARETYSIG